jgi:amidase
MRMAGSEPSRPWDRRLPRRDHQTQLPGVSDVKARERMTGTGELTRRDFVRLGLVGAAGAALGSAGCAPFDDASGTGATPWWVTTDFELGEMSLADLSDAMASRTLTSGEVTRLYLERIAALDRAGPRLRSLIELNPEAEEIAERLDAERMAGRLRGPLHGIPIVVKDNIDTADRMTTTAGSYALEGHVASSDSHVVARLREAGAIILAKANLSEWANFRSTRSSSGWSARGGQCANAYAVDRNPCGSSSGSAAAVSANFCAAALGTETNGSVVCPASVNGLVGLKPTVGLVSRAGIIPIAHTQDTAGPMTRTVREAAALLGVLAGPDPRDPETAASAPFAGTDYGSFLDAGGLRGARIGVERSYFGTEPAVDDLMEAAIRVMAAAGATIVDPASLRTRQAIGAPSYRVLLYEFKADLEAYLEGAGRPNGMATLADLIAFNEANAEREMPYFGQEIFEEAVGLGGLDAPDYLEALQTARRLSRDEGIDALMEEHELDAIVAPTTRPAWKIDLVNRDMGSAGASGPAAVAGYPSITVPNGYVHGLPVGILFFGRAWSEGTLLRLAYAYEQATRHRLPGRMLPTVDLANV